jgi:ribose transport system permease protein
MQPGRNALVSGVDIAGVASRYSDLSQSEFGSGNGTAKKGLATVRLPHGFHLGLDRFSGLYLWGLFIVVFGVWTPHLFFTLATVHAVASEQAVAGVVAIAVLIPLAAGHYDLSVGATANLTGITAVVLQDSYHFPAAVAVLVALGVGLVVGVVNAVLVVKLGVSSFIATLGMGTILAAVEVIVSSNNQPAPPSSTAWNNFTQLSVGGFQIVVIYLFVLALFFWWLLEHTPAGRYLYAIGGNSDAARLSGVRVGRWTGLSLILSAGISGLAGVFFVSQAGPSLSFGSTLLLPAFAAAFLGSTQLQPGRFNVWGTMIAIFVLATGVQGLQLVSGAEWLNDMFDGVALIIAVALAIRRTPTAPRQRSARRNQGASAPGSAGSAPETVASGSPARPRS